MTHIGKSQNMSIWFDLIFNDCIFIVPCIVKDPEIVMQDAEDSEDEWEDLWTQSFFS